MYLWIRTEEAGERIIMVNCHYVPQLILRHFADDERIQYCDLDKKKVETRNIKSAFAEKGYYPDEIEKELCRKTEVQFSNLLNNKIRKEQYRLTLTKDELFILKKYLVITTIRYNITEAMKNFDNPENMVSSYSDNFYKNIDKVLACENADQMMRFLDINHWETLKTTVNGDEYGETKLYSDIKNILHSYVGIVSASRCKEDFIIPDTGFSYKATHLALFSGGEFDKCMYTLNYAMQSRNPYLLQISQMLTPYDYIFVPITKDLAIISFSVFYKFFNKKSDIYGLLPTNGMTVSNLLGFGSSEIVEPPKVKQQFGKTVAYEYAIKMLSKEDVYWLNAVMINTSERYFGYCNFERIKSSIQYYKLLSDSEKRNDLSFMIV